MHNSDLSQLLDSLIPVVARSGEIIREADGRERRIRHKGRNDLVTETDLGVELFLKEQLAALVPEADFLAEETAKQTEPGELTWIIDPLDGTTNFAHGLPFVATSVALWHRDHVVAGVINLPLLGELYSAGKGMGAFRNGVPIHVSRVDDVQDALVATGFPYAIEEHLDTVLRHLQTLLPASQGVRRPGAAALDLAYVACGRYDAFWESALNPWDVAAGILLVNEAGGCISEFDSATPHRLRSPNILASNGLLHEAMAGLLARQ